MSAMGEAYLGIVVAAFLIYSATLFWAMLNTETRPLPKEDRPHRERHD